VQILWGFIRNVNSEHLLAQLVGAVSKIKIKEKRTQGSL
jgi:hypothetical protein